MNYQDALKKVQTKKVKENFLMIEIYYDKKVVLPYKEGIALLTALSNAELYVAEYNKPVRISPVPQEVFKTTLLSATEYEQIKIAMLLNITLEEVQKAELEAA